MNQWGYSFYSEVLYSKQSGPQGNRISIAVTRSQSTLCCLPLLSPSAISDNQMLGWQLQILKSSPLPRPANTHTKT